MKIKFPKNFPLPFVNARQVFLFIFFFFSASFAQSGVINNGDGTFAMSVSVGRSDDFDSRGYNTYGSGDGSCGLIYSYSYALSSNALIYRATIALGRYGNSQSNEVAIPVANFNINRVAVLSNVLSGNADVGTGGCSSQAELSDSGAFLSVYGFSGSLCYCGSTASYPECNSPYSVSANVSCNITFKINNLDCEGVDAGNEFLCGGGDLPRCSDFLPVPDDRCQGGQGLYFAGNELQILMLDIPNSFPNGYVYLKLANPQPQGDTLTRPNGTECSLGGVSGAIAEGVVCPLGRADENSSSSSSDPCESNPFLPECQENSSSSSETPNICDEFPSLPSCNVPGNSSGSGGDGGGDCTDFSNCDWAKLDVQLIQLGVEVEIRDRIKDIVGLLNNGYNISQQQLNALQNLRNDILGAIDGLGDGIGSGFADVVGAINGLGDGGDGMGGFADGVSDGLSQFFGDTIGMGDAEDDLESKGQVGVDEMDDGIDWLSADGAKQRIRGKIDSSAFTGFREFSLQFADSVNLYIKPLTDYFTGFSPVTRLDLNFDSGVPGIKCTSCFIDLTDIAGVNVVSIINGILVLFASLTGLFFVFNTVRTGGHG